MAKSEWVKFKLHGLKEMREALAAVDKDIRHKASRDAGKAALKHVHRRVLARVPRGDSGELAKSVKLSATSRPTKKHSKKAFMVARVTAGSATRRGAAAYAIQQEFGAYDKPGTRFLRGSIEGYERPVLELFKHSLGKSIKKAAATQARRNKRQLKKRMGK